MSAPYKEVGGWMGWGGWGGWWAKANFRHSGTSCCAKRAVSGLQTTLQGKAGLLITVMDNWEQPHTNATLLKPTKYCYHVFRALQSHEKAIRKSRPGVWYLDSA